MEEEMQAKIPAKTRRLSKRCVSWPNQDSAGWKTPTKKFADLVGV